jgi:hypothetical protein
MYKLAFVVPTGDRPRLWLCDGKIGARAIPLRTQDVDESIAALLAEGWEPLGIGWENAIWFRKLDRADRIDNPMTAGRPALTDVLAGALEHSSKVQCSRLPKLVDKMNR